MIFAGSLKYKCVSIKIQFLNSYTGFECVESQFVNLLFRAFFSYTKRTIVSVWDI